MAAWKAAGSSGVAATKRCISASVWSRWDGIGQGEHPGRPLVVEPLDQVAADHHGVLDLAGPVPADLAVVERRSRGRHRAPPAPRPRGRRSRQARAARAGPGDGPLAPPGPAGRSGRTAGPSPGRPDRRPPSAARGAGRSPGSSRGPPRRSPGGSRGRRTARPGGKRESRPSPGGHPVGDRMPQGLGTQRRAETGVDDSQRLNHLAPRPASPRPSAR